MNKWLRYATITISEIILKIKLIKLQLAQVYCSKDKLWSALITLIAALIIITPLCGFLFQCGCNWPWLGLDTNCNFYKPEEKHHCPWCASMMTGVFSTGSAIFGGVIVTLVPAQYPVLLSNQYHIIYHVIIRVGTGLIIFLLIATLTASVAAIWQNYHVPGISAAFSQTLLYILE